jgi:NADPH:quinone reductase-like Zn-dependent oxidoreductase
VNRQVVIQRPGGPEVLAVVERQVPEPGPGMVRVRVLAAGVAYADILMRKGVYPGAPRMPFVPGYDIVGTVDALGPAVAGLSVGQRVAALTTTGGYTTYGIVPTAELILVPDGVDEAEAVSALLNYVTAYQLLHREARVRCGERILVHGAAGGVGTALLELARLAGLAVYGTASPAKHDLVAELGATPLDYRDPNLTGRVRALTGGGVDAVFDGVGGASLHRSYRMLGPRGRLVAYGVGPAVSQSRVPLLGIIDSVARLAALRLIPDGRTVSFYQINPMRRRHPDWFQADVTAVFAHLGRGEIRPTVSERLPLEQAARAQSMLEAGQSRGKIVLVP